MAIRIPATLSHAAVAILSAGIVVVAEHWIISGGINWVVVALAGIIVAAVLVAALINAATIEPLFSENLRDVTSQLQRVSGQLASDLQGVSVTLNKVVLGVQGNLLANEEVIKMEAMSDEVCVVTRDFYWDIEHRFNSMPIRNISEKAVKYTYLCPETGRSKNAVQELSERLPRVASFWVSYLPPELLAANLFEFVLYNVADERRCEGIIVDVFWKRYSEPDHAIDLKMDHDNVMPRFRKLVLQWMETYQPEERQGLKIR